MNGHDSTAPNDVAHGGEELERRHLGPNSPFGNLTGTRKCRHALQTKSKLPDTGETKSHGHSGVVRGSESKFCALGAPLGVHGSRGKLSLDSDAGRFDDAGQREEKGQGKAYRNEGRDGRRERWRLGDDECRYETRDRG
jgi:hypothetical protein